MNCLPAEEVKDVAVGLGHLQEFQEGEPPLVAMVELGEDLLKFGRQKPEQYNQQCNH